jgi:hypothetical protein
VGTGVAGLSRVAVGGIGWLPFLGGALGRLLAAVGLVSGGWILGELKFLFGLADVFWRNPTMAREAVARLTGLLWSLLLEARVFLLAVRDGQDPDTMRAALVAMEAPTGSTATTTGLPRAPGEGQ